MSGQILPQVLVLFFKHAFSGSFSLLAALQQFFEPLILLGKLLYFFCGVFHVSEVVVLFDESLHLS